MSPSPPCAVIIGGGISGLTAAWYVSAQTRARTVLFEAEERLGGKILTQSLLGLPVEAGPDGFLSEPEIVALVHQLGLGPELVSPLTTSPSVWGRSGLEDLPPGPGRHGTPPPEHGFLTLRAGLDCLVAALAEAPNLEVRTGSCVSNVERLRDRTFLVHAGSAPALHADVVVVATSAVHAAALLTPLAPAASALAEVRYLDLGVVTLIYPGMPWRLRGSGFLAGSQPGRMISGCTWLSSKWPHLAQERWTVMRASTGGGGGGAWRDLEDGDLVERVHGELVQALGPAPDPALAQVVRWTNAVPDRRFLNDEHVQVARRGVSQIGGVFLAHGAYSRGGLAGSVAVAHSAASMAVSRMRATRGPAAGGGRRSGRKAGAQSSPTPDQGKQETSGGG